MSRSSRVASDEEEAVVRLDVLVGGTVFCDLVFAGLTLPAAGTEVYADRFVVTPGGPATRAVAVARLGATTGLVGVVGRDMFGDRVVDDLAREPLLDLRWLRRDPAVHTAITVAVTDEHDRSFLTYEEDETAVPAEIAPVPAARVCNVGLGRPVPEWVTRLRASGALVFGGVGWDPTQTWSDEIVARFDCADILCVNDVEATGYSRRADPDEGAAVLASASSVAVVTCGARGAVAHDARTGEHMHVPALTVRAIDPTGAGDVFMAGLMIATLQRWDLTASLRFATLAAALSVQKLGGAAGAPSPADIASFLDEERPAGDWTFARDWARRYAGSITTT